MRETETIGTIVDKDEKLRGGRGRGGKKEEEEKERRGREREHK